MSRLAPFTLLAALALGCTPTVRDPQEAGFSHIAHTRAGVNCTRCHTGQRDAQEASALHLPASTICSDCHDQAHPGQANRDCMSCHADPDTRATLQAAGEALIFDHSKHFDRVGGDCVPCHRGAVEPGRGALPAMADCAECHRPWIEGLGCDRCHASMWAYPLVPLSHQAHTADFARRHGLTARAEPARCGQCHAQSFCAECHDGNAPMTASAAWPDRPDRGFIHRPGYQDRHAAEARLEGPTCLGCHGVDQCRTCHVAAGRGPGDPSPHPVDWASPGVGPNLHASAARRDLLECASCHGGSAGMICVDCHGVGRPGGSPHGGRTPLGDPRADRPCTVCHGGRR
ncbi:MAG: hypothetical protein H6706_29675 [Myxococcales bacterium]|nr:hypothetical protein [Myxococcales bacterium]